MDPYIVSARKYRPSTFASVVGQKALTGTLKNAVASGRLAQSYLFCGSRGVGKTSCARIFAKAINCENRTPDGEPCNECDSCKAFNRGTSMNIIELDAASNNSVDDIRELVSQVQTPPSSGNYRVFIVDEVHMLSSAAFNAFLKTLEEPPSYVVFILATTEKHKIIPTILSRCQIYDFHRITVNDIVEHLEWVAQNEGVAVERPALALIARKADGAMRDALSIFDQVAASTAGNVDYARTLDNLNMLDDAYYNRILDAALKGDPLEAWLIYREIRDKGFDSHFFINGLADYFRNLMVASDPRTVQLLETDAETADALVERAKKCPPLFLYKAMDLCNQADLNYRTAGNKQFLIELTLAKICQSFSPSPNEDSDGEGRLKPIAVAKPAAATQPSGDVSAATTIADPSGNQRTTENQRTPPRETRPTMPPAPTASPRTQLRTAAPTDRKIIGAPSFSINRPQSKADNAADDPKTEEKTARNEAFSPAELNEAWTEFIAGHQTERILSNTMRMAPPRHTDSGDYLIEVENDIQLGTINEALPVIKSFIADRLHNDTIVFRTALRQGAVQRHVLNDRELFAQMLGEIPEMARMMEVLKLRLG